MCVLMISMLRRQRGGLLVSELCIPLSRMCLYSCLSAAACIHWLEAALQSWFYAFTVKTLTKFCSWAYAASAFNQRAVFLHLPGRLCNPGWVSGPELRFLILSLPGDSVIDMYHHIACEEVHSVHSKKVLSSCLGWFSPPGTFFFP